jgi:hypothetical protein
LKQLIHALRWTRASTTLLALFVLVILLIIYFWWPLADMVIRQVDWNGQWWLTFDWLLVGIFTVMTGLIVSGADLKRDALILVVGMCGGLVIESWGTQTHLWTYFTNERPPLWIIPAWPIASLSIDRIVRLARIFTPGNGARTYRVVCILAFAGFAAIMIPFVWPTIDRAMTLAALALVAALIVIPGDARLTLLHLGAGIGLGSSSKCGARRANAGRTTPARRRRCSPCWRMEWRRWPSGARVLKYNAFWVKSGRASASYIPLSAIWSALRQPTISRDIQTLAAAG